LLQIEVGNARGVKMIIWWKKGEIICTKIIQRRK
jgi:hypothetical protein